MDRKNNVEPLSNVDYAATIILGVGVFVLAFFTTLYAKNMDKDAAMALAIPLGICAGAMEQYVRRICELSEQNSNTKSNEDKLQ